MNHCIGSWNVVMGGLHPTVSGIVYILVICISMGVVRIDHINKKSNLVCTLSSIWNPYLYPQQDEGASKHDVALRITNVFETIVMIVTISITKGIMLRFSFTFHEFWVKFDFLLRCVSISLGGHEGLESSSIHGGSFINGDESLAFILSNNVISHP